MKTKMGNDELQTAINKATAAYLESRFSAGGLTYYDDELKNHMKTLLAVQMERAEQK